MIGEIKKIELPAAEIYPLVLKYLQKKGYVIAESAPGEYNIVYNSRTAMFEVKITNDLVLVEPPTE